MLPTHTLGGRLCSPLCPAGLQARRRCRAVVATAAAAGSSSSSPPQPGNVAQSQLPASNTTISSSSNAAAAPQQQPQQQPRKAVVVGGGWAGFGAALALAKAGAEVTLLDASENPGGLSSARTTAGGHVVEPGIKGFWYQYCNIEALVKELGIPSPFTPFTRSSFYTPGGLQVESPIFQNLPRVPAPLGTFVHTSALFRNLDLTDRASALPLLKPLLEHDLDESIYRQYDGMSAYELFASCGVSKQLYDTFLAPMLLVTLFAPPTQLSAAAALGALYYFALAHQADFDVRWCKGPIGTLIFEPLVAKLQSMGVRILGGRRVQEILPLNPSQGAASGLNPSAATSAGASRGRPLAGRVVAQTAQGATETFEADAVVLAAGVPALQQLVMRSRLLGSAEDLAACMELDCSDVLAVRLWLDQKVQLQTPSNVVAGFDEGVGGTLFQLDELQDAYRSQNKSVLEIDLYHAEPLLPLSDEAIIQRMLSTYLAPALPGGASAAAALGLKDASVLRFRKAVTRFSPGSADQLPPISTSVANLFVSGDCVRQGPGSHGCKGLSQEKAYVTGLQAGNAAATFLGLTPQARVLPVEPDEPQITAAKDLLRTGRQLQQLLTGGLSNAFSNLTGSSSTSSSHSSSAGDVRAGRSQAEAAAGAGSAWGSSAAAAGAPGAAAAPAQAGSSTSGSGTGSSAGSSTAAAQVSLLRQDEQLQEMLRNEVVEQVKQQQQQQQQATAQ